MYGILFGEEREGKMFSFFNRFTFVYKQKNPQTRLNFPKLKLVFVAAFPLLH